jgi:Fe2+ or Zn2+ uptake regulation protein
VEVRENEGILWDFWGFFTAESAENAEGNKHFEMADKCTEHQYHPHFVCTDCGKISYMHDASISMATNTPVGFIIQWQQV